MAKNTNRFAPRKTAAAVKAADAGGATYDSFQNFMARVGLGTNTMASSSSYGLNPISRNRTLLEYMYRGSWIVGAAVDCVAEDMTRAGIDIVSTMPPDDVDKLLNAFQRLQIWQRLTSTIKWSRLFGGALAVMMIDGQDPSTPLRIETVGPGQFKGLLVLDRWMCQPMLSANEVVTELSPDIGMPKYYQVVSNAPALPQMRVHHSRVLRFDGYELPYFQRLYENLWSASVLEPVYDRLTMFDSGTQGAAQLLYKAHLRVMQVENLREIIAAGGKALEALVTNVDMIRSFQANESITLVDAKDKFETHQYAFGGIADTLLQLGQQISGALKIPLVRLFGQSPAGLNSTGESDLRTYYDGIAQQQEAKARMPLLRLLNIVARSEGVVIPPGFSFSFNPLWQLTEKEKSEVAKTDTETILTARDAGVVSDQTTLKELRNSARVTGRWTNITDADITLANAVVPDPNDMPAPPGADGAFGGEGDESGAKEGGMPSTSGSKPDPSGKQPPKAPPFATKDSNTVGPLMEFGDMQLFIETPKGATRRGRDWEVTMPAHYGFIRGTASAEGLLEGMDCFVGPYSHDNAPTAFVIDQCNPDTGKFDEHKVMLGYDTWDRAMADYCVAYNDGRARDRIMSMTPLVLKELAKWLVNGDVRRPISEQV